jgi:hypothetical protein
MFEWYIRILNELDKPGILLIILTNRTQVYKVGEARL